MAQALEIARQSMLSFYAPKEAQNRDDLGDLFCALGLFFEVARYASDGVGSLSLEGTLWASSYYVGTAGNVSAGVITRYILQCQRL